MFPLDKHTILQAVEISSHHDGYQRKIAGANTYRHSRKKKTFWRLWSPGLA